MPILSTGPIEREANVVQLRLKVLNNSNSVANVTATVFSLDGTKRVSATRTFTLAPNASGVASINIPTLAEFEVQFNIPNNRVLVGVFAVGANSTFSASNSVRSGEMVTIA